MKISAFFSKYMEGQQVSAYDKNDNIIDGVVRIKENKKYLLSDDGKAFLLTEMKKIKPIGRLLNEEAEEKYKDALQQFSDYYKNTFDTEKVEKANDQVKEKIIGEFADNSDDSAVKANKNAFVQDALTQMNTAAAQEQIDKGNSTVDLEIEKLKKNQVNESLFSNKKIQEAILKEMELEKSEDSDFIQPRSQFGLSFDARECAADDCVEMILSDASKDEIIEELQLCYEMSKDEATNMYNEISDTMTVHADEIHESEIIDDIEKRFEEALDNVPKELYGKNCVVEYLAECFKLDAQKALKESADIAGAIKNLISQAKSL